MADSIPTEWIVSLQDRLKESDGKIDALGVHLDNKFQDLDGKLNKLTEQYHKIELALSNNWHETTQEVSTCRHAQNNKLQVISNNTNLCKEERIRDLSKTREDFSKDLVEVEKSMTKEINNLTLLTNANKLKIGMYAGIGSAVFYFVMRLLGI